MFCIWSPVCGQCRQVKRSSHGGREEWEKSRAGWCPKPADAHRCRLRRMKNKKKVLDFWPVVCIVHCGSIFIYVLQWKMTILSSHPQMKPGADTRTALVRVWLLWKDNMIITTLLFTFNLFIFIYLVVCLNVCLCDNVGSPKTAVTDSRELPCECWELNPNRLEEQSVHLIAEPSLQPRSWQLLMENISLGLAYSSEV